MSDVEIWHNPRCSKSRAALELLASRGVRPKVVSYLEAPPSAERLNEVLRLLSLEPRDLMRRGEAVYKELELDGPHLDRAALIGAMVEHPVLIEQPIVISGMKAVVGRPPEKVLEVL